MATKLSFLELCQMYAGEVELDEGYPSSVDGQTGELARMVQDIRSANVDIQLALTDWKFRRKRDFVGTTASGSNAVTITTPSDTEDIAAFDEDSFWLNKTSDSGQALDVIDYEEWRDYYEAGTQTSAKPDSIIIMPDNSLKCYPQADATYTISCDYFNAAVDFSASGGGAEYSVIPKDYHRLIVLWAQMHYYAKRESAFEFSEGSAAEYQFLWERLLASQAPDHQNAWKARTAPQRARAV